jgi:hypothetical protein
VRSEDHLVYTYLASAFQKIGDDAKALDYSEKAICLNGRDMKPRYLKASLLQKMRKVSF